MREARETELRMLEIDLSRQLLRRAGRFLAFLREDVSSTIIVTREKKMAFKKKQQSDSPEDRLEYIVANNTS